MSLGVSWGFGGSCSLGDSLGMNAGADGFKSGILNDCFIMNSAVFIRVFCSGSDDNLWLPSHEPFNACTSASAVA